MELPTDSKEESPKLNKTPEETNQPQNTLEIGGPFSAFTSLYRHGISDDVKTNKHVSDAFVDENVEKVENHIFQNNIYRHNGGIFQDLPVAPAFAQIFQRRRRRENRPRRQRTTFTSEQTLKLELEYSRADYITRPRRYELAELLNLTESQIKIWFQNRRAKDKRIEKAHMDHQLRAMGFSHFHGQFPFPVTGHNLCGTCVTPPMPLPFPQPLYPGVPTKPFKLL